MVSTRIAARRLWQASLPALGRRPALYLPFSRWRYGSELAFGSHTEIVIEGFPRSANSFAVDAFRLAQARHVPVAHHLHAPAQVMAAARSGVPAVVLVRDPKPAIVSYLLWERDADPQHAAANYLSFYQSLKSCQDDFVVADFDQVTTDFGTVIGRVNARFGTAFHEFDHSEDNVKRCFEAIERDSRARRGDLRESEVARPSETRKILQLEAELVFERGTAAKTRDELNSVYAHYRSLAGECPIK